MSAVPGKSGALVAALVGLVLTLLALPLDWFTVTNARVPTPDMSGLFLGFGEASSMPDMGSLFSSASLSITAGAFNGTVDLFTTMPIWSVVVLAALAGVLGLLRASARVHVPWLLLLLVWTFAAAHVGMILYSVGTSPNGELGPGPLVLGLGLLLILPSALQGAPRVAT
jgi:hypothetical protein